MDSFLQWLASSPPATWVQALGTPIIGLVAAYVAYQSAATARKKLKFDMFEKRLRVYEEVRAFFKLTDTGALTLDEARTLSGPRAHARFLFADPGIDAFLNELSEKSLELFYMPMPKRPSAVPDSAQQTIKTDPDPTRTHRNSLLSQYRLSKVTTATPPEIDGVQLEWFRAATWIIENKARWDTLTLKYLQLNH
ncbi:hypothetical protein ACOTD6_07140 [Achromobacter xylosoxidans]